MTDLPPDDLGASIRQRLLDHARLHHADIVRTLTRFAIERFLFRLSRTEAVDNYFLKGAMLFAAWPPHIFRPSGDLDLLGHGASDQASVEELFTRICRIDESADGIVFDPTTIEVGEIREEDKYEGVRVTLNGVLEKEPIPVQVDIGFGDHVHPEPIRGNFPCLLQELPPANILMYPRETVVAEKFEAMVRAGVTYRRLKDFYDIWATSRAFPFELDVLVTAVRGTLQRRETAIPTETPVGLTPQFADAPENQDNWEAFLRRTPLIQRTQSLEELLAELRQFLGPVIAALAVPESARGHWNHDRSTWEDLE